MGKQESIPDWLPDWWDESQYPAPPTESTWKSRDVREKWAWEFLRRNPEYQKDYKCFKSIGPWERIPSTLPEWITNEPIDMIKEEWLFGWITLVSMTGWIPNEGFEIKEPPGPIMEEWLTQWNEKTSRGEKWFSPVFWLNIKYGFFAIYPPAPSIDNPFADTLMRVRFFRPYKILYPHNSELHMHATALEVPVLFHLGEHIEPQVRDVKQKLLKLQKLRKIKPRDRKPPKSNLLDYLRILDAKLAGKKTTEIAAALFPYLKDSEVKRQKVKDVYRAAKFIRDGKYRDFIF